MTLKTKVKVIWIQWHLKTIEWAIIDLLWICESNRRSICNFIRPWLYTPMPVCINCRALAWEGVYVYKLAFFFWFSPRTYHFLFEKRLIIEWRYFWRNIALSLILERSPDYPLKRELRKVTPSKWYLSFLCSIYRLPRLVNALKRPYCVCFATYCMITMMYPTTTLQKSRTNNLLLSQTNGMHGLPPDIIWDPGGI